MLGFQPNVHTRKTVTTNSSAPKLIGYILTTKNYDPGKEAVRRLDDRCTRSGFQLGTTEWDVGYASNPYRVGLWRTLRQLVCTSCDPRRMPFSLTNFEDFIQQSLKPCVCRDDTGYDGVVVSKLDQLSSEPKKGTMLVMQLAIAGKHLVAEDGICLSCCHPAMKRMLNRAD